MFDIKFPKASAVEGLNLVGRYEADDEEPLHDYEIVSAEIWNFQTQSWDRFYDAEKETPEAR